MSNGWYWFKREISFLKSSFCCFGSEGPSLHVVGEGASATASVTVSLVDLFQVLQQVRRRIFCSGKSLITHAKFTTDHYVLSIFDAYKLKIMLILPAMKSKEFFMVIPHTLISHKYTTLVMSVKQKQVGLCTNET